MKSIIIMVLMSICIAAYSQEPTFRGVGELKVGETTTAFINAVELKSKKKIKKLHAYSSADDANYNKFIVEYVKPVNKCSDAHNPLVAEHKVYVIYNYAILDQYLSPKIFLEFYNDTLYHFIVSEPEFVSAFKTKYGEPVTDEILHNSSCVKDGEGLTLNEKDIIESWDEANIHAAYMVSASRAGAECDKVLKSTFEITNMETNKLVQQLEHDALKKCQENEIADKNKIPDNF